MVLSIDQGVSIIVAAAPWQRRQQPTKSPGRRCPAASSASPIAQAALPVVDPSYPTYWNENQVIDPGNGY